MSHDVGLTHIALACTDLEATIAFYARFADMQVVHRRGGADGEQRVAWLSDRTRPFVIVFLEGERVERPLGPIAHLGVGVDSRAELERRVSEAQAAAVPVYGPQDSGPPLGYWAFLTDPDGHKLELSFGQEVRLTVEGK